MRLDDKSLRQRWRRLMTRPMPDGLGRALVFRILAYQQQSQIYGDLDPASRRALTEVIGRGQEGKAEVDSAGVAGSSSTTASKGSRLLRRGTMLTREHGGVLHRVMVMEQGFVWNGRTYDSLSKVAFAITGTRWNGPRFFGLRDKDEQAARSETSGVAKRRDASGGPGLGAMTQDARL